MCLETLQEQTLFSRERAIPELVCLVFELVVGLLCRATVVPRRNRCPNDRRGVLLEEALFAAAQGLEAVTDRLVGGSFPLLIMSLV